ARMLEIEVKRMVAIEVAMAVCTMMASGMLTMGNSMIMKGTSSMPPPMPSRPAAKPPKAPSSTRLRRNNGSIRLPGVKLKNDAAAEADIAVVQHRRLAGRHRPLSLLKLQVEGVAFHSGHRARRVGLPVAGLGSQHTLLSRRVAGHPAGITRRQGVRKQPGVIVPLHHIKRIVCQVFARRVPGVSRAIVALHALHAADSQALALTQRMKGEALVLAQHLAFGRLDGAGLRGQVAIQELAEGPLTDKADAGRIFLGGIGQPQFGGNATHLGLGQLAQRKARARELRLIEAMQEVALVLGGVEPLKELELRLAVDLDLTHPRVVPGGDQIGTQ